jgi:hypothetical protein
MKTIKTRNGSFLTGSELADAVIDYGVALGKRRLIDLVDIPVLESGIPGARASFTVGWMSDTATMTALDREFELVEDATVLTLRSKTQSVGALIAHPFGLEELAREYPLPYYLDLAE